jgi:hypothetical protein
MGLTVVGVLKQYAIVWSHEEGWYVCVYLPLVLGMGLVEVEAVAEHDPRGYCDLGPATKTIAFVRGVRNQPNASCAREFPEISTRAAA